MKKIVVLLLLSLVVIAAAWLIGCDNVATSTSPSGSSNQTAVQKTGTELAKVGNTVITVEEFEAKISKIPPFYRKRVSTPEGKREFLDRLVMDEIYYEEALRKGLDQDADYTEQIESIKRNILASKIKKQILEQDVNPSDEELLKEYEDNKAEYQIKESLKLRHILVKVSRKATEAEEAKAKATIEKAAAEIKGGKSFEEVAKEYSEDKHSAKKGGEIPPVRQGVKSAEFDAAAWALTKPGQVSSVFNDRRGYNLLQFVEKEEASFKEFDKVKAQIQRKLENERRKTALDDFNANLKNKTNVVIHEELLAVIAVEEEAPAPPAQPGMPAPPEAEVMKEAPKAPPAPEAPAPIEDEEPEDPEEDSDN